MFKLSDCVVGCWAGLWATILLLVTTFYQQQYLQSNNKDDSMNNETNKNQTEDAGFRLDFAARQWVPESKGFPTGPCYDSGGVCSMAPIWFLYMIGMYWDSGKGSTMVWIGDRK